MVPKTVSQTRRYIVTVVYREPSFERRQGTGPRPREGSFVVFADNEESAVDLAVAEFHRVAALSWVGWPREIVSTAAFPRLVLGGRAPGAPCRRS